MLKINPDFSTLWNHRRELLLAQQLLDSAPDDTSSSSSPSEPPPQAVSAAVVAPVPFPPKPFAPQPLAGELAITAAAIRKQVSAFELTILPLSNGPFTVHSSTNSFFNFLAFDLAFPPSRSNSPSPTAPGTIACGAS